MNNVQWFSFTANAVIIYMTASIIVVGASKLNHLTVTLNTAQRS